MAKIPNLSLSRYYAALRSRPGENWNALAMQDTERHSNLLAGAVNSLGPAASAGIATVNEPGIVKPDGRTITVGNDGTLSVAGGASSSARIGAGTVTSVGLAVPSRQTVTGSPVTSAGTITIADNPENANTAFMGPSSGSAAAPSFRAIVPADLPLATSSAFGIVKPDNTTITISGGVISAAASSSGGYPGESPLVTPVLSNFTQDNFQSGTTASSVTVGNISSILLADTTNTSSYVLCSLLVPITNYATSNWTATMRLRAMTPIYNWLSYGIVLKNSTNGKYLQMAFGNQVNWIALWEWSSNTSFYGALNVFNGDNRDTWQGWLRATMFTSGSNQVLQMLFSRDGSYWFPLYGSSSTWLSANPDYVGFGMSINKSGANSIVAGFQGAAMACDSWNLTYP